MNKKFVNTFCNSAGRSVIFMAVFAGSLIACYGREVGEVELPPPEMTPRQSSGEYNFKMMLSKGMGYSLLERQLPNLSDDPSSQSKVQQKSPVKLEPPKTSREVIIGSKIVLVREFDQGGKPQDYFFGEGWCAYDDPVRGRNVRNFLAGRPFSEIYVRHFPELSWATKETQQPDPPVKEGVPVLHIYALEDMRLEVDARTGLPIRFLTPDVEYTYRYSDSLKSIVMPGQLSAIVDRLLKSRSQKL